MADGLHVTSLRQLQPFLPSHPLLHTTHTHTHTHTHTQPIITTVKPQGQFHLKGKLKFTLPQQHKLSFFYLFGAGRPFGTQETLKVSLVRISDCEP